MPASYNIVDSKIMEMKPFTKSNYNTGHFWSRRPDNIYKKKIYTAVIKMIYYLINDDWKNPHIKQKQNQESTNRKIKRHEYLTENTVFMYDCPVHRQSTPLYVDVPR